MSDQIEEDPTHKQRREQARAQHSAPEATEAASAVRRKRLTQLGIVASVVVAMIVVVLIATGASGSSPPRPGSAQAVTTEQTIDTLLAGIPQSANVLGQPTAPVTLEYFGDLECPYCKAFTLGALPSIIRKWVRSGHLRIEYRSMETATREPEVFKTQQVAALAAGKQNKMWYFIETFYHEQGEEDSGYVTESYLQGIASQVPGLNLAQWTSDRNDPDLAHQIATDKQAIKNAGFHGTPSFLIGRTGEAMETLTHGPLTDPKPFNEAIETLLEA